LVICCSSHLQNLSKGRFLLVSGVDLSNLLMLISFIQEGNVCNHILCVEKDDSIVWIVLLK
jgi:hypothetical protein